MLLLQTTIRGQGFLCLALAIGHAVNAKLTLLITEPPRKAMSGFGAWLFAAPLLNEVSCPVKLWGLGLTASSTSGFQVLFKSWGWPPVLHQELAATAAQPYRRTWPAVSADEQKPAFRGSVLGDSRFGTSHDRTIPRFSGSGLRTVSPGNCLRADGGQPQGRLPCRHRRVGRNEKRGVQRQVQEAGDPCRPVPHRLPSEHRPQGLSAFAEQNHEAGCTRPACLQSLLQSTSHAALKCFYCHCR